MIKNYIIDTNVMIHDPYFYNNFEDNNIIIPIICIEELDKLKNREGIKGFHARCSIREINTLMGDGSLKDGVRLPGGGLIRIEMNHMDTGILPNAMSHSKNDNLILAICLSIMKDTQTPTILITKDVSMQIKADSLGISTEDYKHDKITETVLYKGYSELSISKEQIGAIYSEGLELPNETGDNVFPNHFFHFHDLSDSSHEVLAKFDGKKIVPLRYEKEAAWGLRPMNKEQKMAFELLMDPSVHFVSMAGGAGSGKTILATSVALQKVIEEGIYRKIIFVRPVVSAGNDIGFLPGDEAEKLNPWMSSFYDAIDNLMDMRYKHRKDGRDLDGTVEEFIDMFRQKGIMETKTFNYMRGRTLSKALVIVDEAQQTTPHLAKLMLTRAGHDSKFVFVGDPSDNQIDNVYVDSRSNGLIYAIEKMKKHQITGHVTLKQVERSPLAKLAEKSM